MWAVSEVCAAIEDERKIAQHPIKGRVLRVVGLSGGLRIDIAPLQDEYNRPIDEALEGARAWWPNDPPVNADVYAVDPDEPSLVLRKLTGRPPEVDETIWIYEPDFYRPLAELWGTPSLADRALRILTLTSRLVESPSTVLNHHYLRRSQRRALGLPRHVTSLLWGPPGTGKTTTLGALIAEEIASRQSGRILVTATTHTAVDQTILAVDKALESAGLERIRHTVKRFGSRVDPTFFVGREHLLPVQDKDAFEALTDLLRLEPVKADLETWSEWKKKVDEFRSRLKATVRETLAQNACVGMTVTSAFFWFQALREAELDLVVVDEASQFGGPGARMIAVPTDRVLFAGDPKQLPAVVRTKDMRSKKILGATAFDLAPNAPQVFLEEQSRMAPLICSIVSKVFYDGKLVVAQEESKDDSWHEERSPYWIEGRQQSQFQIHDLRASSKWSAKYNGPIRFDSAEAIVNLIANMLAAYVDPKELIVLTPFRAQRALLRKMLSARRTKGISVSTVHRAQGSERKIVIFDPVDGASKFLSGVEGARLINVAISRAQAQVVVFLSDTDRCNKTLQRIALLATAGEILDSTCQDLVPTLKVFAYRSDFPTCLQGKLIRVGATIGEVVRLERGGEVVVIACRETGLHKKFKTKVALRTE